MNLWYQLKEEGEDGEWVYVVVVGLVYRHAPSFFFFFFSNNLAPNLSTGGPTGRILRYKFLSIYLSAMCWLYCNLQAMIIE